MYCSFWVGAVPVSQSSLFNLHKWRTCFRSQINVSHSQQSFPWLESNRAFTRSPPSTQPTQNHPWLLSNVSSLTLLYLVYCDNKQKAIVSTAFTQKWKQIGMLALNVVALQHLMLMISTVNVYIIYPKCTHFIQFIVIFLLLD